MAAARQRAALPSMMKGRPVGFGRERAETIMPPRSRAPFTLPRRICPATGRARRRS